MNRANASRVEASQNIQPVAGLIIGAVAFMVTAGGFMAGNKVGAVMGKRAGMIGGLILIAIGIRIVVTHIFYPQVLLKSGEMATMSIDQYER